MVSALTEKHEKQKSKVCWTNKEAFVLVALQRNSYFAGAIFILKYILYDWEERGVCLQIRASRL